MTGRSCSLILQRGEAILLERLQDVPDVLARELQAGGDALLMPSLVVHTDDGPPRLVCVFKLMEQRDLQWKLDWDGVAIEEALDGEVMGPVPVLALDDAGDLAVVDTGIELLQIEDVAGDDSGIAMPAPVARGALVDQAEHAMLDEAAGLLTDGV